METSLVGPCSLCHNQTVSTMPGLRSEFHNRSNSCPLCVRLYQGSPLQNKVQVSRISGEPYSDDDVKKSIHSFCFEGADLLSYLHFLLRSRWSWLRSPSASTRSASQATFKFSYLLVLVLLFCANLAGACSSRSTPKPRPPSQGTMRPNITFQTYACPPAYAAWYCLNGATCFTVKIADSILYNCECADGYMGQRCEFKDLDGSYLPARERLIMGQNASIGQVFLVVLLIVMAAIIASVVFTLKRTKSRSNRMSHQDMGYDDGFDFIYGGHSRSVPIQPHNNNTMNISQPLGHASLQHQAVNVGQTRIGNGVTQNDTTILGQSISYTLSRQGVDYSSVFDDQYTHGTRSLSRYYNHRVPHVCYRATDHYT